MFRTTQQDVGLDTDRLQLLHRVLRRLCLQFASRRNIGKQRDMQETGLFAAELVAKLADGLKERQRFDIPDSAPDLTQNEIFIFMIRFDERLDGVSHMRNDLYRCTKVIAATFAGQHIGIDPARCHIV